MHTMHYFSTTHTSDPHAIHYKKPCVAASSHELILSSSAMLRCSEYACTIQITDTVIYNE